MDLNIKSALLFLDKKAGKEVPFRAKVAYFPETFGEDAVFVDSVSRGAIPMLATFPKHLVVRGSFVVSRSNVVLPEVLEAYTARIEALGIKKLPSTIAAKFLYLYNLPNVTQLPENLKISDKLIIGDTPVESLPENLTTRELGIAGTHITSLPDLKANEIHIDNPDIKYPDSLEPRLYYGNVPIREYKDYQKQENLVALAPGIFKINPVGLPTQIPDKLFTFLGNLKQSLGISWKKAVVSLEEGGYSYLKSMPHFSKNYYILGEDEKGRPLLFCNSSINYKNILYSPKKNMFVNFLIGNKFLTVEKKQEIFDRLFPEDATTVKTKSTAIKASDLVNDPRAKVVSFTWGRLSRSGKGVEGSPKELLPSVPGPTRESINALSQKESITWDKMYIYSLHGDAMVAVFGHTPDGTEIMYDKYGYRAGAYSKVRTKTGNTEASAIINGNKTVESLK